MKYIFLYLLIINAAVFILMLSDKRRSKKNRWRISERTLLGSALLGGSIGVLLGMYAFRHKTRHLKFTLGVPAILIAQVFLVYWLLIHF